MRAVKFLERPTVIQFFGVCLMLAPFFNILSAVYFKSSHSQITWDILKNSLLVGTLAQNMQNALSIGSFLIGFFMLKGSVKAWSFVLILIGLQIVIQATTLMKDLKQSWFWGALFGINIGLFFFIADQLVIKTKPDIPSDKPIASDNSIPSDKPIPKNHQHELPIKKELKPVLTTGKRIFIHFTDLNMWGQLLHISSKGLWVRSMEPYTGALLKKPMIIFLRQDLSLPLLLDHCDGDKVFFKFLSMDNQEIQKLNEFILSKSNFQKELPDLKKSTHSQKAS